MSDTKRDILVRINEEMLEYDEQYGEGMTHEDGFDFAKRLIGPLYEASIEIVRLRAERLLLVAVAEAAEDINKMLSCVEPPDLETATNTTLALEEALTRWHCR